MFVYTISDELKDQPYDVCVRRKDCMPVYYILDIVTGADANPEHAEMLVLQCKTYRELGVKVHSKKKLNMTDLIIGDEPYYASADSVLMPMPAVIGPGSATHGFDGPRRVSHAALDADDDMQWPDEDSGSLLWLHKDTELLRPSEDVSEFWWRDDAPPGSAMAAAAGTAATDNADDESMSDVVPTSPTFQQANTTNDADASTSTKKRPASTDATPPAKRKRGRPPKKKKPETKSPANAVAAGANASQKGTPNTGRKLNLETARRMLGVPSPAEAERIAAEALSQAANASTSVAPVAQPPPTPPVMANGTASAPKTGGGGGAPTAKSNSSASSNSGALMPPPPPRLRSAPGSAPPAPRARPAARSVMRISEDVDLRNDEWHVFKPQLTDYIKQLMANEHNPVEEEFHISPELRSAYMVHTKMRYGGEFGEFVDSVAQADMDALVDFTSRFQSPYDRFAYATFLRPQAYQYLCVLALTERIGAQPLSDDIIARAVERRLQRKRKGVAPSATDK
jgi:hypothetical protein